MQLGWEFLAESAVLDVLVSMGTIAARARSVCRNLPVDPRTMIGVGLVAVNLPIFKEVRGSNAELARVSLIPSPSVLAYSAGGVCR